jgi:IQ calmodulin-binding motif
VAALYNALHHCTALLQAWRAHVVHKQVRVRCKALAVITLALPRMHALCAARREQRRMRALAHAATPIQAAVRGWLLRRRLRLQHSAATTIQAHFRAKIVRRSTSPEVRHQRQCVAPGTARMHGAGVEVSVGAAAGAADVPAAAAAGGSAA